MKRPLAIVLAAPAGGLLGIIGGMVVGFVLSVMLVIIGILVCFVIDPDKVTEVAKYFMHYLSQTTILSARLGAVAGIFLGPFAVYTLYER